MEMRHAEIAFAHGLISGTFVHEGDFAKLQEACGISLCPNGIFIVSIDRYPQRVNEYPPSWPKEVGHALRETVANTMAREGVPTTCIWTEEGVLVVLFQMDHACGSQLLHTEARVTQTAKLLQHALAARDLAVSIGISALCAEPLQLRRAYQEALRAMSGRFFQGKPQLYRACDVQDVGVMPNPLRAEEKLELIARVKLGDVRGVSVLVPMILLRLAEDCQRKVEGFKSEVIDLLMQMSREVVDAGISAAEILSKNARFVHDLYQTIRYDTFVGHVLAYAQWLTSRVDTSRMSACSPVIRDALQYIHHHHQDPLTLDQIAKVACLSKYHLSHRFKQEVGLSVMDYVRRIRLEKAAFYLTSSTLSLQQIATLAGFSDANYFGRMFKKEYGCTPKAYRTAHAV